MSRRALAVALAALLAGGCGGGGAATRLGPDPLSAVEPSHRITTSWRLSVAALEGRDHGFDTGSGAFCDIGPRGQIGALDLDNGKFYEIYPAGRVLSTGVLCADGYAFAVDESNRLVAYGREGGIAWERPISGSPHGMPVFVREDEAVVVATASGRVTSYRASDGEENWTFTAPVTPILIEGDQGLVVSEGMLLAGIRNGKLYAIDAEEGYDLWETTVAVPEGSHEISRVVHVSPPVLSESVACVSAYQGNVACVDIRDGRTLWSRQLSSTKRPALAGRAVLVLDTDDTIHAFAAADGAPLWTNDSMRRRGLRLLGAVGLHFLVGDFEGYLHALDLSTGAVVAREGIAGGPLVSATARSSWNLVVRSADGVIARVQLERI